MSWVTVIWSISAGACLTLAFLQFIVWCKRACGDRLPRRCSDRYPYPGDERPGGSNAIAMRFAFHPDHCPHKGVKSSEFLAGVKAAADSIN
jgi:hypothetical protein